MNPKSRERKLQPTFSQSGKTSNNHTAIVEVDGKDIARKNIRLNMQSYVYSTLVKLLR